MPSPARFSGFSQAAVDFYAQLARHNSRAWFQERKDIFEREVLAPARALVVELGQALSSVAPGLHADPRVNRSLFRIQRDTRFSPDKSPYKTHLGLWLWEGQGPRMECPGYYFHLEPPNLMVSAGAYIFTKPQLHAYRQAAAEKKTGAALDKALAAALDKDGYILGGGHYQRVPRGYAPDHPRAELLKHNGLYIMYEAAIPPEFHTPGLVDWCVERYLDMTPLHLWLYELMRKTGWQTPASGRGPRIDLI